MNLAKLLMLAGTVAAASATQITFQSAPAGVEGFWAATDTTNNKALQLLCDDYFHQTTVPSGPFTYLESRADTPTPWQNVRWNATFFPSDYQARYRAAAFLVAEILGIMTPSVGVTPTMHDYQWAMWDLFDWNNSIYLSPSSTALALENQVYGWATAPNYTTLSYVYNRLVVYTPDPSKYPDPKTCINPQEFLAFNPVPEPSQAVGLLAALGIGWLARRRRTV